MKEVSISVNFFITIILIPIVLKPHITRDKVNKLIFIRNDVSFLNLYFVFHFVVVVTTITTVFFEEEYKNYHFKINFLKMVSRKVFLFFYIVVTDDLSSYFSNIKLGTIVFSFIMDTIVISFVIEDSIYFQHSI